MLSAAEQRGAPTGTVPRRARSTPHRGKAPAGSVPAGNVPAGSRQRSRPEPQRTCVGCGVLGTQGQLVRCVYDAQAGLALDVRGVAGRGAWLHPELTCIRRAVRGGLAKSFKTAVQITTEQIVDLLHKAAARRLSGLVHAAQTRHRLVLGRDAVRESAAHGSETLQLVLLAQDAGSLAGEGFVQHLGAAGKLAVWGTKQVYGQWLGRGEVAILAITEPGLAKQIAHTLALLRLSPYSEQEQGTQERTRLPEDR